MAAPTALYYTTDEGACRLLAEDPFALLVGFALDQQVPVPTAFAGPLKLKQRLGTLDPAAVAAADLEPRFRLQPAVHRFPGTMAQRVRELAQHVVDEYGGDEVGERLRRALGGLAAVYERERLYSRFHAWYSFSAAGESTSSGSVPGGGGTEGASPSG